jgi:isochorismate synthase EntC
LTDDKNRSEVDAVIEEVIHELRSLFGAASMHTPK